MPARQHQLVALAMALLLLTHYLALIWLGPARFFTAPNAQRIFYFHVPVALVTYLAFALVCGGSIAYLRNGSPAGDRLAHCATELGLLFGALTLITGTLWMRAEWGGDIASRFLTDVRLSTTLVMWLIYAGYLVIRRQPGGEARRAAAVVAVLGFVAVPLSYLSVRLLPSEHPQIAGSDEGALAPAMLQVMLLGVLAMTLLFAWLLRERLALARMHDELLTARLEAVQ